MRSKAFTDTTSEFCNEADDLACYTHINTHRQYMLTIASEVMGAKAAKAASKRPLEYFIMVVRCFALLDPDLASRQAKNRMGNGEECMLLVTKSSRFRKTTEKL